VKIEWNEGEVVESSSVRLDRAEGEDKEGQV